MPKRPGTKQRSEEHAEKVRARYGGLIAKRTSLDEGQRWIDVDGDMVLNALYAVTQAGDAILFNRSSDGGALGVVILAGDERIRQTCREPEEMTDFLERVIEGLRSDKESGL